MNGITEIKIPEIEGLDEAFAENTGHCPASGIAGSH
jgi:hypothetical protein